MSPNGSSGTGETLRQTVPHSAIPGIDNAILTVDVGYGRYDSKQTRKTRSKIDDPAATPAKTEMVSVQPRLLTQVPPSFSLTVPSGQPVFIQVTSVKSAPVRFEPNRLA